MAVGQPLQYAMAGMTSTPCPEDGQPYYPMRELLIFLAQHGIMAGMFFNTVPGTILVADDSYRVDVSLQDIKAILAVTSPTRPKDWEHFVFWDGKHVRDPNPAVPATTALEDYKLLSIYPLTYLDESEGG
jgi:hypothetical protein